MKPVPREHRRPQKIRKYPEIPGIPLAPLGLENYNAWQQRRSGIRQWLVERIAERAVEIFQSRRNAS